MAPQEARELRVNIMAMVSIGYKILEQMDKTEKPLTAHQKMKLKMEAKVQEYLLTGRKPKPNKLTK